jgi:hypothetical protein
LMASNSMTVRPASRFGLMGIIRLMDISPLSASS